MSTYLPGLVVPRAIGHSLGRTYPAAYQNCPRRLFWASTKGGGAL